MLEISETLVANYGYFGLFASSFLASTVLPIGSEGVVVLLMLKGFNIASVVVIATIGNYLGACTTYYIGLKGRDKVIEKYLKIDRAQMSKAEKLFKKYGAYALLFTWLPLIGDTITITGGILKFEFRMFSVLVFTGKFLRYLTVAYLASLI